MRISDWSSDVCSSDLTDLAINKPMHTRLPGAFIQDEISFNETNKLLLGARYDYNSINGSIFTPRINYKWNSANENHVLSLSVDRKSVVEGTSVSVRVYLGGRIIIKYNNIKNKN